MRVEITSFPAGHDSADVLGNDELRLALCFLQCGTGRARSLSISQPQDVVSHANQRFVSASLEMTGGLQDLTPIVKVPGLAPDVPY